MHHYDKGAFATDEVDEELEKRIQRKSLKYISQYARVVGCASFLLTS